MLEQVNPGATTSTVSTYLYSLSMPPMTKPIGGTQANKASSTSHSYSPVSSSMTQVVWVKSKGMYPLSQIKVHLEPNAYLLDSQSSLLLGGTFLLWQSVRYNLMILSQITFEINTCAAPFGDILTPPAIEKTFNFQDWEQGCIGNLQIDCLLFWIVTLIAGKII